MDKLLRSFGNVGLYNFVNLFFDKLLLIIICFLATSKFLSKGMDSSRQVIRQFKMTEESCRNMCLKIKTQLLFFINLVLSFFLLTMIIVNFSGKKLVQFIFRPVILFPR